MGYSRGGEPFRLKLSRIRESRLEANADNATKYRALAHRAETGEFDDYADVHVCGPTALHAELNVAGFTKFAERVAAGEFDATAEESEEWARSQTDPQIVALMQAADIFPGRSRGQ